MIGKQNRLRVAVCVEVAELPFGRSTGIGDDVGCRLARAAEYLYGEVVTSCPSVGQGEGLK